MKHSLKPYPEVFASLIESLSLPEDTIFSEDIAPILPAEEEPDTDFEPATKANAQQEGGDNLCAHLPLG